MAWPPPALPTNRTNALGQQDNHPGDHNALALAVNDLVARVQAGESRSATNIKWGQATVTGNQDGRAILTHNLGRTPTSIVVTVFNGGASPIRSVNVFENTSNTQCWLQLLLANGTPSASGQAVTVFYMVAGAPQFPF